MNRNTVFLVLIFVGTFLLRVFPYLYSGVPYHTDTWFPLRTTETLLSKTPVALTPESGFDSYDIAWPGIKLFGALLCTILQLAPASCMPVFFPLVSSTSIFIFFALLRRLGFEDSSSLLATLLYAFAGPSTLISAGVLKEAYAYVLFTTILLVMTLGLDRRSSSLVLLSGLLYSSLVITHHFTSFVALILLFCLAFTFLSTRGVDPVTRKWTFLTLAGCSILLYCYLHVYASHLPIILNETDIVSLVSYLVVATLPIAFGLALSRDLLWWAKPWFLTMAIGVAGLIFLILRLRVGVDTPVMSSPELMIMSPHLIVWFMAAFAVILLGLRSDSGFQFVTLWSLCFLAFVGYLMFGTPGNYSITYRFANFLYIGLVVLAARMFRLMWSRSSLRIVALIIILFSVSVSAYTVPYAAFYSDPIMGSQRVYTKADLSSAEWIQNVASGARVYGDLRFSYLVTGYFGIPVDVDGGFRYFFMNQTPVNGCLISSALMRDIGYVTHMYGTPVPLKRIDAHVSDPSIALVYSNGLDEVLHFRSVR
jgi:hypothetical protein